MVTKSKKFRVGSGMHVYIYTGKSLASGLLTNGVAYFGKPENGYVRVLNNAEKWSKYGADGFSALAHTPVDMRTSVVGGYRAQLDTLHDPIGVGLGRKVADQLAGVVTEEQKEAAGEVTGKDHLMAFLENPNSVEFTPEKLESIIKFIEAMAHENSGVVVGATTKTTGAPVAYTVNTSSSGGTTVGTYVTAGGTIKPVSSTPTINIPPASPALKEMLKRAAAEEKKENNMDKKPATIREFLISQGVSDAIIRKLAEFRKNNQLDDAMKERIEKPDTWFIGPAIWPLALTALLNGKNLLLEGAKATGKNTLADNLAYLFGRPKWDISFHVSTGAESLIGGDTFRNGAVEFRPGAVYECSLYGGFGILDEINMAKADALAVLHSVTDRRRVIDVPGYERLKLDDATRFIGTMNSGYTGTRELNEALVSRFVVLNIPSLTEEEMTKHLKDSYPQYNADGLKLFARLFNTLNVKAINGEISTKAVDFRGILDALDLINDGIAIKPAIEACVVNKVFDTYERNVVRDVVKVTIPDSLNLTSKGTNVNVDFSKVR